MRSSDYMVGFRRSLRIREMTSRRSGAGRVRASCSIPFQRTLELGSNRARREEESFDRRHTPYYTDARGSRRRSPTKSTAWLLCTSHQKHRWMFGYHTLRFCFAIDMTGGLVAFWRLGWSVA
jgi:hypothetical protein